MFNAEHILADANNWPFYSWTTQMSRKLLQFRSMQSLSDHVLPAISLVFNTTDLHLITWLVYIRMRYQVYIIARTAELEDFKACAVFKSGENLAAIWDYLDD